MEPDNPSDGAVLRQAVLSYLKKQPNAMDALKGIADWWIEGSQTRVEMQTLERVLKDLTECGVLQEIQVAGEAYYRLAGKEVK
jgi:Fe2+ or Zn2+ uptake regulation protein